MIKLEAPDYLSGIALDKWNEIVPKLERNGLISKIDSPLIAIYCQTFETQAELERDLMLK